VLARHTPRARARAGVAAHAVLAGVVLAGGWSSSTPYRAAEGALSGGCAVLAVLCVGS